ncbi:MAG: hypothetical protein JSS41_02530 [Proteobacteria bacterium]|nr:hypothetical protein [Pseudomonadota bacterium]
MAGGPRGMIAGGIVGGLFGLANEPVTSTVTEAVANSVGGRGAATALAATGTTVGLGAMSGFTATVAGNALYNTTMGASDMPKNWDDGVYWGMATGALAPLGSAEAFAIGGEASYARTLSTTALNNFALSRTALNNFAIATGAVGVGLELVDPNAAHGLNSH